MAYDAPELKNSKVVQLKSCHLDIIGNFNGAIKEEVEGGIPNHFKPRMVR